MGKQAWFFLIIKSLFIDSYAVSVIYRNPSFSIKKKSLQREEIYLIK